jgi:hypothetical protein
LGSSFLGGWLFLALIGELLNAVNGYGAAITSATSTTRADRSRACPGVRTSAARHRSRSLIRGIDVYPRGRYFVGVQRTLYPDLFVDGWAVLADRLELLGLGPADCVEYRTGVICCAPRILAMHRIEILKGSFIGSGLFLEKRLDQGLTRCSTTEWGRFASGLFERLTLR